jgi:hypothetical protein
MPKAAKKPNRVALHPRELKPIPNPIGVKRVGSDDPRRATLLAYAEWLFREHQFVCLEIDPDFHPEGGWWCPANTAASNFHFPNHNPKSGWKENPPSSRAKKILDLVGVKVTRRYVREVQKYGI